MEIIAGECGFGNVNSMRNVFQRTLKIPPGHYRRHFRSMRRVKRQVNEQGAALNIRGQEVAKLRKRSV
jgi:AraC-like DNA-binding protein